MGEKNARHREGKGGGKKILGKEKGVGVYCVG